MSITLSQGLPANVVEIGNEVTQAKIDEINSGTLALQTWVTLGFAPKASPTFTGTVTIPAGASISGYLTTSSASSTYQTISGMTSYLTTSAASSTYQTIAGMSSYLTDAPSDGSEYVRKNGAWSVATGGGGGGISDAPSDGNLYARQNAAWTSFTVPTLSVTNIDLTGNFNGYNTGSGNYTFKFDSSANTLRMQNYLGSGITISPTEITFPDSTTISTAPVIAKIVNTQTASYTLTAADTNNIVYVPAGSGGGMPMNIFVPEDTTYNFAIGTIIILHYDTGGGGGAIDFTTTGAGSPTLVGNTGTMSAGTLGHRILTKLAANYWYIS